MILLNIYLWVVNLYIIQDFIQDFGLGGGSLKSVWLQGKYSQRQTLKWLYWQIIASLNMSLINGGKYSIGEGIIII